MKTQQALKLNYTSKQKILYMAMELSNETWKLAMSNGEKIRKITIEARDLAGLLKAIGNAKEKLNLPKNAKVMSCYEAGRDGFWIHRFLLSKGIENQVVDSSSIETNRRAKKVKTDRIDAEKLVVMLMRYIINGERKLWSVVNAPSVEQEDARRLHREFDRLKKEKTQHTNRIKSLLILHGIYISTLNVTDWSEQVKKFTQWDGQPLPPYLQEELIREGKRLALAREQMRKIQAHQLELIKSSDDPMIRKVAQLLALGSIGLKSAWLFVMEFYGWRDFKNGRQIGSLAGLTGTPYNSGDSEREQGISKAGNRRLRAMIIEIAWMWLRVQPNSRLTRWYQERFANGGKRMRRIGIVALARRLLIELWRYLETGAIPAGAHLKAANSRIR
jgi:transposase